jgi:hypothetical protein
MSATRRSFLTCLAAAPFAAPAAPGRLPIRKAVEFSMLPRALGVREKFQLAQSSGRDVCGRTSIEQRPAGRSCNLLSDYDTFRMREQRPYEASIAGAAPDVPYWNPEMAACVCKSARCFPGCQISFRS